MKYCNLFENEKPFSRIVLGCGTRPFTNGENCDKLLDEAVRLGINTFDTARGYGKSERVLGDWIKKHGLQGNISFITKGGLLGPLNNNRIKERCIRSDLERSLNELQTDRIDYYLLHRDNKRLEVGEIVEWMNALINEKKIVRYGVSNWKYERIIAATEYAEAHHLTPPVLSEAQYSLAAVHRWVWVGCTTVTGEQNKREREWYASTRFPLLAFSPLANGFLSGRVKSDNPKTAKALSFASRLAYATPDNLEILSRSEKLAAELQISVPQLALAWLLHSDMNVFAIVGSAQCKTLQSCADATEIALSQKQLDFLNATEQFSVCERK